MKTNVKYKIGQLVGFYIKPSSTTAVVRIGNLDGSQSYAKVVKPTKDYRLGYGMLLSKYPVENNFCKTFILNNNQFLKNFE